MRLLVDFYITVVIFLWIFTSRDFYQSCAWPAKVYKEMQKELSK